MTEQPAPDAPRLLAAGTGEINGPDDRGSHDRYMIDGADSGGHFALVEHLLGPRALAAPLHRHTREDEYSYVLEGRVGAVLGGDEAFAEVGDLIFKPRDQWHTFWNAGDAPARILEIISPAGLEDLFRQLGSGGLPDPETLAAMAAEYGADIDFAATIPIVERHGLAF
ncbi:MAG TPA: cupin domain-containing protein [Egibacteraceae bacterium]|nr:cupin domain-containing protein [Egibacteraceae bacterium]